MSDEHANDESIYQSLQRRIQDDAAEVFRRLFDEYASRLVGLACNNIHPGLKKRFDGEDVVQSVFRTFFRRQAEGHFSIEHKQQLWTLLATLTLYKTRSQARRHTAEKRNANIDRSLAEQQQMFSRQASPEDAMVLWEELEHSLDGLPSQASEIVSMRLEGWHRTEIAEQLNLSRQTIHRILKLVQQRLEKRFEEYF